MASAPEGPGLYAWYAVPLLGQADVASVETLFAVLDDHSALYARQSMKVEAQLNFDLYWNGHLDQVSETNPVAVGPSSTQELSPDARKLLMHLIHDSHPMFSQPLYIGKAPSGLRQRLQQHAGAFLRLRDDLKRAGHSSFTGEDDFAQRAVRNGFNEDQLSCYAIEITTTALANELGDVVGVVEKYLNTWATPLLGRR